MTDIRHEATTNTLPASTLTKKQKKSYGPRAITYNGEAALITADGPKRCPDCDKLSQFGGLCSDCRYEQSEALHGRLEDRE